ncbi:MAG: hypothetical protein LQ351_000003 [Letrouitia transgressa]|nr:MAG: hypothetical protein LQ351_000003 [Letrouitia transgressa]
MCGQVTDSNTAKRRCVEWQGHVLLDKLLYVALNSSPGHSNSSATKVTTEEAETIEEELKKEYDAIQTAKRDLMGNERGQMGKIMYIEKLKQKLSSNIDQLREMETKTLSLKRRDIKNMVKEYNKKLNWYEDTKTGQRQGKSEETSAAR